MSNIDTIKAEIADLKSKARLHRNSHNEGGYGYNPYDSKIGDACNRLRAAKLADYASRWEALRAGWNAAIAKYSKDGRIDLRDLPKIEAEAGISMGDLHATKSMIDGGSDPAQRCAEDQGSKGGRGAGLS